jgi:heme-degrading monooxygenase HmoA
MIRVLIERHVAEDLIGHYEKAARDTLQLAMGAHGFISGEVLKNAYDPNHRLVVATYRTLQDWQRWASSPERKEMMEALGPMLETEEKVTIYEH